MDTINGSTGTGAWHVILDDLREEPKCVLFFSNILHDVSTDIVHSLTISDTVVANGVAEEYSPQHLNTHGV